MSNEINLLSDGTFASKIDEQNAILEEIRDNVGGGGSDLKTAAVRSDSPDSQGVSQLYKLDAQGNRTNVYPALSPVGTLNWVVPKTPSLASNTDDVFISDNNYTNANPNISSDYSLSGNVIKLSGYSGSPLYLWIKNIAFGITSNDDFERLFTYILQYVRPFDKTEHDKGITAPTQSTSYLGYTVIEMPHEYEKINFKLLYG